MTPTINVNLKKCPHGPNTSSTHEQTCIGRPIPLPCPIPRTVEMTVRLGECECGRDETAKALFGHMDSCPARPIRVTCSIGGDGTWAGSEVVEVLFPHEQVPDDHNRVAAACRARWEIVKALMTGGSAWDYIMSSAKAVPWATITALLAQRDAVFAALAKMATLEHEHEAARLTLPASCRPIPATGSDTPHPSADALRLYVSHLIAKVSAL